MKHYETTFIIDPLLPSEQIKQVADSYVAFLKNEGCEIVHHEAWGIKSFAYPINKRSTGAYYIVEYRHTDSDLVERFEVQMRRDERILRYMTMSMDKHAIKYLQDKRAGLIGKRRKQQSQVVAEIQEELAAEKIAGTDTP